MAHAQKPDFVFRRNERVHLNRRGRQFSRLLAAEACASAVLMLDTPCSEDVWRVLATHSIRQFPLHFPSCTSPCAITFQLDSTSDFRLVNNECHCTARHNWNFVFMSLTPWNVATGSPKNMLLMHRGEERYVYRSTLCWTSALGRSVWLTPLPVSFTLGMTRYPLYMGLGVP